MKRTNLAAAGVALMLLLSACAGAGATEPRADEPVSGGAAGTCLEGTVDCVDTVFEPEEIDDEAARTAAQDLLGVAEEELTPDVRVGQRGDEHMMLTEDYVLGRMTVALEEDGDGVHRVVSVTVELPDGPETVTE